MTAPPATADEATEHGLALGGLWQRGVASAVRAWAAGLSTWKRSLHLRVVLSTLVLSIVVVAVLGDVLLGRITTGLLDAKRRSALDESRAGLTQAQLLVSAADRTDEISAVVLVDQIAKQLANRAGSPSIYEVLLLASGDSTVPERGSNQVDE